MIDREHSKQPDATQKARRKLLRDLEAEAARHDHLEREVTIRANMARLREARLTKKRLDKDE